MLDVLSDLDQTGKFQAVISHVLLSYPYSDEERQEQFYVLLSKMPIAKACANLRGLVVSGETESARRLAEALLEEHNGECKFAESDWGSLDSQQLLAGMSKLQSLAGLCHLAGQSKKGFYLLKAAEEAARNWQAGLHLQGLADAEQMGEAEKYLEKVMLTGSPELIFKQPEVSFVSKAAVGILDDITLPDMHPFLQLRKAQTLKAGGELAKAQLQARSAVDQIIKLVSKREALFTPRFVPNWNPLELIRILESLDLEAEALQTALLFQQERPNDLNLLHYLSGYLDKIEDYPAANAYAHAAAVLKPKEPENFRKLASLQEKMRLWKDAYESWAQVIRLIEDPNTSDWMKFGKSAYQAEMPRIAAKACESAIEKDPENEKANALMGKVLQQLEDFEGSIPFFTVATQAAPKNVEHWIDLSNAYVEMELNDHALSTLQAGHAAVPNSASINYSLGKLYQTCGKPEKALPFLETAAGLNPESSELAYELGLNLFKLQENEKAKQILAKSLKKWPQDHAIARLLAELALKERDYESAVPALEIAIQASDVPKELKLAYVDALFNGQDPLLSGKNKVQAAKVWQSENILRGILEKQPHSFVVQLGLAEVLGTRGQNQDALELFKILIETPNVTLPEWRWRLYAGMGAVADSLEIKDLALASMKEAAQAAPDRPDVMKKLAEVYLHAELPNEAFRTIQTVRNMAPDQIGILIWYADMAKSTGHIEEALEALGCATQINAQLPELWVRLAACQNQLNDATAMRESLKKMALLKDVPARTLREAAYLYIGLQELREALTCLSHAVASEEADPALVFDLACVQARCGDAEDAEENLRELISAYPENACLYMFQADLLVSLDRVQGALASLQHVETLENETKRFPFNDSDILKVLPEDWYRSLISPEALDLRMGVLHESVGDSQAALSYLEKALVQKPESAQVRYMVADLADALLCKDKAARLLSPVGGNESLSEEDYISDWERNARAGLYALIAANSLKTGSLSDQVEKLVATGLQYVSNHPGLLALISQNQARNGDMQSASENYEKAVQLYEQDQQEQKQEKKLWQPHLMDLKGYSSATGIQVSEAAFALERWDDAVRIGENLAEKRPYEGRSLLHLAGLIVRVLELNQLTTELKAIRHVPSQKTLDFANEERFNDLINRAENIRKSEEVVRWAVRGNMVFHSSLERIRSFAKSAKSEEDLVALVAALRRSSNFAGAIQIGKKYPGQPKVLVEYGLSLQKTAPQKGFAAIFKATELQPKNPLTYAALAVVAQEAGMYDEALSALETSLEIWSDEPEWHAWAAQLAELEFEMDKAVKHWETAVELVPDKLEYRLALGNAYIGKGEFLQAVGLLEGLSKKEGDQGQVWLLLSKAYQRTQTWEKALQASERAAVIDRFSPEPVLQSGKIALSLGKQKKAMECARLALKRAPGAVNSILFLCEVQKAVGKSSEALRILEEAINGGQQSSEIMLERSRLVHAMKGAKESEPLLLTLVEDEPENAEALGFLAEVQLAADKPQEASMHAFRALKIDPTLQGLNYLIGTMKRADGHLDQAVHYFSEAVRQNPQDLEAYVALGETYLDRRENSLAFEIFEKAMGIAPDDYRLYYQAGVILREQKDYMGAEDMMRRASELAPGDVNIRRQLGAVVALNLVHNPKEVKTCL
ncbi:MAG: tetratricopeptide repeat protein [Anaerolineaceae bacterium]|nr:tetratricopeptide repeat protein [Anaerolineaceae bacterium]